MEPNFESFESAAGSLERQENGIEKYEEAVERAGFLLDSGSEMLLLDLDQNDLLSYKTQIWRGVSAIGQARVIMEGIFGKMIARENPQIADSFAKLYEIACHLVKGLPDDDPAAVISRWRLEKPLTPVLPDLTAKQKKEANTPCQESIYVSPAEFIEVLRGKSTEHAKTFELLVNFAEEIKNAGGRVLLVGGAVRDMRTNIIPKDFDIEIYGLDQGKIVDIAKNYGTINEVGSSFAVRKVKLETGMDIDLAIPRVDSQATPNHQDVKTLPDPNMPIREACRRRDFTINSMAADILTGELFDFFGGDGDLKDGILRVTDERLFCDDPLRVMRGLQFIGRQALNVNLRTQEIMRLMVFDLDEVNKERFRDEWTKLLLKSQMPSLGLIKGMEIGVFNKLYPEFCGLLDTRQSPEWHPEGNAWIHTLMVVDEAIKIIRQEGFEGDSALGVMLAALCHDLGKTVTTKEDGEGKITSAGHEAAGVPAAAAFMEKIGISQVIVKKVLKLIENHMAPAQLYAANIVNVGGIGDGAIRNLALRLGYEASIEELVALAKADNLGRGSFSENTMIKYYLQMDGFPAGPWLLDRARALNVEKEKPKPLLRGDIILQFGFKPGPAIGHIIRIGDRLRDEKGFTRQMLIVEIYRSVLKDGTNEPQKIIDHLENLLN